MRCCSANRTQGLTGAVMTVSLTRQVHTLERLVMQRLRKANPDELSQVKKRTLQQIRLACHEVKLDIRDYEYAETRTEQLKWAKVGRHNLKALEQNILLLDDVFGPADVAELSASIDHLRSEIR
jgi:exonuclease I